MSITIVPAAVLVAMIIVYINGTLKNVIGEAERVRSLKNPRRTGVPEPVPDGSFSEAFRPNILRRESRKTVGKYELAGHGSVVSIVSSAPAFPRGSSEPLSVPSALLSQQRPSTAHLWSTSENTSQAPTDDHQRRASWQQRKRQQQPLPHEDLRQQAPTSTRNGSSCTLNSPNTSHRMTALDCMSLTTVKFPVLDLLEAKEKSLRVTPEGSLHHLGELMTTAAAGHSGGSRCSSVAQPSKNTDTRLRGKRTPSAGICRYVGNSTSSHPTTRVIPRRVGHARRRLAIAAQRLYTSFDDRDDADSTGGVFNTEQRVKNVYAGTKKKLMILTTSAVGILVVVLVIVVMTLIPGTLVSVRSCRHVCSAFNQM